jgi:hypothetical protein
MTRRETQDAAWNTWDDDAQATGEERVLAALRANPQGLTHTEIQRALRVSHETASARCRELVKKGRVRWSREYRLHLGKTVRQRVWVLGEDTPEERAGTRMWPPVYTEVRRLVEQPDAALPDLSAYPSDRPYLLELAAGLIRRAEGLDG